MSPWDTSSRLERVFDALLEAPKDRWEAVARLECGDDEELAREALSLLHAATNGEAYLSGLAQRIGLPTADDRPDGMVGRMVGPYRLVRLLGRGGMGAVYLAERDDRDFTVRAALKLLTTGMLSKSARERFRVERRILSTLEHPNIARLFDGGVTEDYTPFFVMEYVDGRPIDEYCDQRGLSIEDRIDLFLEVCSAVRYAHENLVIHRDLKPDNVLIGAQGEVKLLDFGIARVMDAAGSGFMTRTAVPHPMTVAFASPEQLRGLPLTTGTDVYGLGVLLYRLLVGVHPYPIHGSSIAEAERTILEVEPTALARAVREEPGRASLLGTTATRLERALKGDLGDIVMMALRKEPERRYRSVAELVEDLERYRAGRPVTARPDTLAYRVGRFVRRNRAAVMAGVAIGALLSSTGVLAVKYTLDTREQSRVIAREAALSEEVFDLFLSTLSLADPGEGGGDTLTVRAALTQGLEDQRTRLAGRPDLRARLLQRLAGVYSGLGLDQDATAFLEEAVSLTPQTGEAADTLLGMRIARLAGVLRIRGVEDRALSEYQAALDVYSGIGADSLFHADVLSGMAQVLRDLEATDSARTVAAKSLDLYRRRAGADDTRSLKAATVYASVLRASGETDSATALVAEVVARAEALDPVPGDVVAPALNNLGYYRRLAGDLTGAEAAYRRALDEYGDWIPLSQRQTVMVNIATVLDRQGDTEGALHVLRERVDRAREWWPEGSWRVGSAWTTLAAALVRYGDTAAAEAPLREAISSYEATIGPEHAWTANAESQLGAVLAGRGQSEEAERYLLAAYEKLHRMGPDGQWTLDAAGRLADFYEARERPAEAARYRSSGGV